MRSRCALAALAAAALCQVGPVRADLLSYVRQPDAAYKWSLADQASNDKGKAYTLKMTSQRWEGFTWEHSVVIVRPAQLDFPATSILVITGGHPSKDELGIAQTLANACGTTVSVLFDIPNQPLFDRHEDELIAYTFSKYLETGDANWPLLFPMTKSAVRAMDTVEAFGKEQGWPAITGFVVAGASKRGWTTWLTAAADPGRVRAIMPMVYDNLNLPAQMPHQLASWGQYSEMIQAYTKLGIQQQLASPRGRELSTMVDPYTFRNTLKMPKLIVNGTNDPYWAQDALNLYWNDLPAPKYVLYATNSGHGLENRLPLLMAATAFVRGVAGAKALPNIDWSYAKTPAGLRLTVSSTTGITAGALWVARSATQDFRKSTWTSVPFKETNGQWVVNINRPQTGYMAALGEMTLTFGGRPFPVSTQVAILKH